jgi:hypothetical protein
MIRRQRCGLRCVIPEHVVLCMSFNDVFVFVIGRRAVFIITDFWIFLPTPFFYKNQHVGGLWLMREDSGKADSLELLAYATVVGLERQSQTSESQSYVYIYILYI